MIVSKTYKVPLQLKEAPDEPVVSNVVSFSSGPLIVYSIKHETRYRYSAKISHSKHLFRLQPEHDIAQMILDYQFSVSSESAELSNFVGSFGNHASFIEIKEPYSELTIMSKSVVGLSKLPKKMDLLHQPRTLPMIWMPWDRVMMQAYLQPPELAESQLFELSEYAMGFVRKNQNDVFEVLTDINKTIFNEYAYVPGVTTFATTPYETYFQRRGVCQDFANLLICLARLLDIPARYRTGYLYTGGGYENRIQADATHAWAEVFLPYVGWTGFDPTNGCLAEDDHIRVACGRNPIDATPTSGAIFKVEGNIQVQETLSTSVKVKLLS